MTDRTFSYEYPTRFRDIDAMGHVNNAVYATYLEQARADLFDELFDADLSAVPTVLVHLSIDYERPIQLGETVRVELTIDSIGTSSLEMSYEVKTGARRAARAETVQVFIDRETEESAPIPDRYRTRLEAL
ncbi:acyl-CoA thioesterase [Natronorarus salvus]|uniref:acyl-CoA thioesterase n=1 Tax=Natronorarus salvus TaxID=3117733 RepID=UPI002F269468